MKKYYTIYNRSADSVIVKADGESNILLPHSTNVLSLTAVELTKYSADNRLIIKSK